MASRKGIDIPGLVERYYEPGPTSGISPGQIVWIPALYPDKNNVVIDIDVAADPSETKLPAFLRPLHHKLNHFPVKTLGLGSEEHAFVLRGKIRPAVVLLEDSTRWPTTPPENLAICVPIFGVDKPRITQTFVLQAQAFQYPSKFYLPPDTGTRFEEGVARLELMQTVHRLSVKPFPDARNPIMLADEFFELLGLQMTRFLGGVMPKEEQDTLEVYGELILEEARRQGVVV